MRPTDHDPNGWHPNEEELVLLFYGDADPGLETRLSDHLDACDTCQPVWQEIRATLNAVDAAAVPEPPADFERVIWARVQRALDDIPPPVPAWWSPRLWVPAGVLATVLLTTFIAGRGWPGGKPGTPAPETTMAGTSQPERALLVAMDDHLQRSELLLVEVMNAPPGDAVRTGFERETADDLLASSRLYRQTATHTGHEQLAAMLEDLEGVLVEIARGPEDLEGESLNALRARIAQDDLIFKVRVVSDEIHERQKTMMSSSEGDR